MKPRKPYRLRDLRFWKAYAVTARPYLFFVSGAAGLVGLALSELTIGAAFLAAFAAFCLSYGLGQAVTDVFQTDTDSLSSPYRPLVRGEISRRHVLGVSLAGLALCIAALVALNPWNLALGALCVVGLLTYTPMKRRWWAGPAWNSWIVALLPAMGFLCGSDGLRPILESPGAWGAMASVFFSYAIFVLLGYFKDIEADRKTGYRTLPVVFGWNLSVQASLVFAVCALVSSAGMLKGTGFFDRELTWPEGGAWGLWTLGAVFLMQAHWSMFRLTKEKDAHGPIAHCVRGFVLLHLGEAAALRPALLAGAAAFYAVFEVVLAARPEKSQI